MGCDIHSFVEVRRDGRWHCDYVDPFGEMRNYAVFGFLADVRNYSHSPVIAEPRGLPEDVSGDLHAEWYDGGYHSASWLSLAELLTYDYDQVFWDRRVTKNGNGAALAEEGEGRHVPLREFLGTWYFEALDEVAGRGDPADTRFVFWFDS